MKALLGLSSFSDQAAVLEAAFEALTQLTAASAQCTCHTDLQLHAPGISPPQATTMPAFGVEQAPKRPARMAFGDQLQQPIGFEPLVFDEALQPPGFDPATIALPKLFPDIDIDFAMSDFPEALPSEASHSSTARSVGIYETPASSQKNEFSACMLSSLMVGGSVSLDSFFLKTTVAIFLNNNSFDFLDCNQAGLDILGTSSKQTSIDMDKGEVACEEQVAVDQDVAVAAMNQLALSDTVTSVQRVQRMDGTVIWIRSLVTKVVHNGSTPGYMGIMQHVLAPEDGRAKVWTNDHLVCVGRGSSHPPMV